MAISTRLLTLFSLMLFSSLATAAATQIKIATIAPENSSWMRGMRAGGEEIKSRTEGRVVLKFYGGGVMGNDKKILRKMRIGQLHGGAFTPSGLTERFPNLNVYGMPLVFRSLDEVDYVRAQMDDEIVNGAEEAGLVCFGIMGGGFAELMSNSPVRNVEDIQGRKIWVPEGDPSTYAAMQALELSPVILPITDVLTGLQTGLIDVIATPPVAAVALQWYTKVKYLTREPLLYTYAVLVIEKKVFDGLVPDDQAVLKEVMGKVYAGFDDQSLQDNVGAEKAMIANGVEIVQPDAGAVDLWRDRVLTINRQQVDEGAISADLYDRVLALLDEYRGAVSDPLPPGSTETP
jgi:TRAP-type C4-dicarboxylate transport system substrate-binding protein